MFFKLVTLSLQTTSDLEICSIQVSFWSFLRSNYVVLQIISDLLTIFSYCLDKIDGTSFVFQWYKHGGIVRKCEHVH